MSTTQRTSFPKAEFFSRLTASGMPEVPQQFSVVPCAQLIPHTTLNQIDEFIRLFDRVTTSAAWLRRVTAAAPEIARARRREICFFTAWDFHLSPERGWQLIECNDNGSGFLYAALINRIFYELSDFTRASTVLPPPTIDAFENRLAELIDRESREFSGTNPQGVFLIVETSEALADGKFYREFLLLRELLRQRGRRAEMATPDELRWDGETLLLGDEPVVFIINRATDFFWGGEIFAPLRAAYLSGKVYVAPNPFSYATRSDKRLLELLSLPHWDREIGITPEERAVLSAHVPETYVLTAENLDEIAPRKTAFFFKPAQGFASHGVLPSSQVGKGRLRQLLRKKLSYVAQKTVPKPVLVSTGNDGEAPLWTDLRVWSYRGERYLISGRASKQRDLIDLDPPGGWLPTFEAK
jgi:hypothetical protein